MRDSESGSRISSDLIESNLPEFKYERRNPGTPSDKGQSKRSKHLPLKEQIKAVKQSQRFSHTQCNFKYTMPKHKSNRKREHRIIPESKTRPPELNMPIASINYFNPHRQKEESEESYLAEETPVHRNRTYVRPNNHQ
jgi:hypothetical protein